MPPRAANPSGPFTILHVAEKPSIARTIAGFLSGGSGVNQSSNDGVMVLEFPYRRASQPTNMVVTAVAGHLHELQFPPEYRTWTSCPPQILFDCAVSKFVPKTKESLRRNLEKLSKLAHRLILWLDCDREGENIAYEVLDVCLGANRNLDVRRARFSALIADQIIRAYETAGQPDKRLADAVDARQEIDLRLGSAFTRMQTMTLQRLYKVDLVSYGPCQFPTLRFVVDRWKQREEFKSEPFWYLDMTYAESPTTSISFTWDRVRVFDQFTCLLLLEECLDAECAIVLSVAEIPKSKWRPRPLSTIEMQKRASRFLGISSDKTMEIAEDLYQKGFISYPRTETTEFDPATDIHALVRMYENDNKYGAFATRILNGEYEFPARGGQNDKAHPPIHPTTPLGSGINGDAERLYDFITRHFLACCMPDAKGAETKVDVQYGTELFHASGLCILSRSWLDVYPYEKWSDKAIPQLKQGTRFTPTTLNIREGSTTAPTLLTESELIGLMEKHGIGTDATVAQHIETIKTREYVKVVSNVFHPTPLGIALIKAYARMGLGLATPALRAMMERDVSAIAAGAKQKEQVVNSYLKEMKAIYLKAAAQTSMLVDVVGPALGARLDDLSQCKAKAKNFSICGKCRTQSLTLLQNVNKQYLLKCSHCPSSESDAIFLRLPFGKPTPLFHAALHNTPVPSSSPSPSPSSSPTNVNPSRGSPFLCPICHYQALSINNTATHKSHTACPYCFNYPPPYSGSTHPQPSSSSSFSTPSPSSSFSNLPSTPSPSNSQPDSADIEDSFRCFQCMNQKCPISTGVPKLPILPCPSCHKDLYEPTEVKLPAVRRRREPEGLAYLYMRVMIVKQGGGLGSVVTDDGLVIPSKKIYRLACMGTDGEGQGKCNLVIDLDVLGMRLKADSPQSQSLAAAPQQVQHFCQRCASNGVQSRIVTLKLRMDTPFGCSYGPEYDACLAPRCDHNVVDLLNQRMKGPPIPPPRSSTMGGGGRGSGNATSTRNNNASSVTNSGSRGGSSAGGTRRGGRGGSRAS